jgi:flagellar biosynthesis/type III secretory pathway ATPase
VGSDPRVDYAIAKKPEIDSFLQQRIDEPSSAPEARAQLELLMGDAPRH